LALTLTGPVSWIIWRSAIRQRNTDTFHKRISKTHEFLDERIETIEKNRTNCPVTNIIFYITSLRALASQLTLSALYLSMEASLRSITNQDVSYSRRLSIGLTVAEFVFTVLIVSFLCYYGSKKSVSAPAENIRIPEQSDGSKMKELLKKLTKETISLPQKDFHDRWD
jgi:L-lactate permease